MTRVTWDKDEKQEAPEDVAEVEIVSTVLAIGTAIGSSWLDGAAVEEEAGQNWASPAQWRPSAQQAQAG